MTGLADISAGNMARGFAGGDAAIVASRAGTQHLSMIHRGRWDPAGR